MRFDFLDLNSGDFAVDVDAAFLVVVSFKLASAAAAAVSCSSDPLLLNMTGKLMAKIRNPVSTPMSVHGE